MAWFSVAIFFPRIDSEQSASQKKCSFFRTTCPSGTGISSGIFVASFQLLLCLAGGDIRVEGEIEQIIE
jgi:hypothetical protein